MRFSSSAVEVFLLIVTSSVVTSFVPDIGPNYLTRATKGDSGALFLSPEDLTDYMAKAHEEKLRAIKAVEEKKNDEIKTLKTEVTELKENGASIPKENAVVASSQPPSGMNLSSMTTEQLRAKLVVYQDFMAKYIVQAQQQKMKAVKAAELATAAKYEEKIKLLLAAAPASDGSTSLPAKTDAVAKVKITPKGPEIDVKAESKNDKVNGVTKANGVAASAPATLPSPDIFDQRNKKVAAAGKAGKSRWGDAETKKASAEASKSSPPSAVTPPAAPAPAPPQTPVVVVTPEIEAADHGLRSDGGVGGPSLAERVNLGQQLFTGSEAVATAPPEPIVEVKPPSVYDLRNGRIARAAAAGKSRWGTKENIKATKLAKDLE